MRTKTFRIVGAMTALALAGGLTAVQAQAAPRPDAVQRSLDALVNDDKYPAALAAVVGRDGRTRDYATGVADLDTGEKVPANARFRIASNTKMFTATVVMQLVGEGRIDLDAPVEQYLPGVVRDDITVRQLLQHTSGLADYDAAIIGEDYTAVQHRYFEPHDLVDAALAETTQPEAGTFSYSNTNYILAGLVVQKVTGRPISEEITNRIIKKLRLRDTYWPELGDQTIRGRHPHGYMPLGEEPTDVTEMDPSMAWAAGALIGTPRDLNTFLTALLDGKLVKPAQLAEMKKTVPAPDFTVNGDATYGLGIGTFTLSCGGVAWTHGGTAPGYVSANGATEDGRAATVVVTSMPTTMPAAQHIENALDTAICG